MKIIATNKKAHYSYHVITKYETGICLQGTEVKSIRASRISLNEAFVVEKHNELFLINALIPEYDQGNRCNHSPTRQRKLLVHKSEIRKISQAVNRDGLTVIPLKIYFKDRWIKLEIAVCKGKAKSDKRQDKIKQEANREMARAIKLTNR
ncbi:MAG: SsrA-binding protein SmpB [Fibrobacteria bacterium]|nr:SsrA-binding protein SmpB [Fibrobacteria bacterium]